MEPLRLSTAFCTSSGVLNAAPAMPFLLISAKMHSPASAQPRTTHEYEPNAKAKAAKEVSTQ